MILRLMPAAVAIAALGVAMPAQAAKPEAAPAADAVVIPAPPKGKGEVVFFRSGTIMGAAISCAVNENGKKISSLPPGDYVVVVADPGKHSYTVESEAKDTLTLEVEPDEVQYATCHVKMGIMAGRPVLQPAKEAEFKAKNLKMVAESKMGEGALRADGSTSAPAKDAAAGTK